MEKQKGPQVIGARLPRTGTSSVREALKVLGFDPCHHMISDVLGNVHGCRPQWVRIMRTADKAERQSQIREILQGYNAVVHIPTSIMIDEMVEIYPDAKVIWALRSSPGAWRKSFNKRLEITNTPWWVACTYLYPSIRFLWRDAYPWWERVNAERYGGAQVFHTTSTLVYDRHNEFVRRLVPKEQLLEFSSEQGWGPSCEFLDVPAPEQEYPHALTADDIRREFFVGAIVGAGMWLGLAILGCGAV